MGEGEGEDGGGSGGRGESFLFSGPRWANISKLRSPCYFWPWFGMQPLRGVSSQYQCDGAMLRGCCLCFVVTEQLFVCFVCDFIGVMLRVKSRISLKSKNKGENKTLLLIDLSNGGSIKIYFRYYFLKI